MPPTPISLREDQWEGSKPGKFFQRGRLLKIDEIEKAMARKEYADDVRDGESSLSMLRIIRAQKDNPIMHCMMKTPARLEVSRLQHVTGRDGFQGIFNDGSFKGKPKKISENNTEEWRCFSWWSVAVPRDTISSIRRVGFEELPCISEQVSLMKMRIYNQFANSPVFKDGSRYGNFKFSFSVEDLVTAYQDQHCSGGPAVFRILGTWTYQQEILHTVLVHGPQYDHLFQDLPEITRDTQQSVYQREDGVFMFNLESTSITFTLRLDSQGHVEGLTGSRRSQCVWNNPSFAFFLPEGGPLKLDISRENLGACKDVKPVMQSRGDRVPVKEATKLIQSHFQARDGSQGIKNGISTLPGDNSLEMRSPKRRRQLDDHHSA
ncbi:hypothetical protein NDU88_009225 [Pleurodeles waltl]|uniref:Uncharacterized protein n=1 Tax=Pleurodeles waltl TaxID=8319 RepID=A0AAV7P1K4_PLEWA|nr:hypothetical protein NDU88_009225 [Pleurodeles waltl]